MTAKHTPGPWLYEPAGDSDGETIGIDHFVVAGDVEMACPRTEADARLIASAPDLLTALRELVAAHDSGDGRAMLAAIEQARVTIDEATKT